MSAEHNPFWARRKDTINQLRKTRITFAETPGLRVSELVHEPDFIASI
jgi:hypothetical protein